MNSTFIRQIVYYQNYYLDFFENLKPEVKKKFNWTLQLISTIGRIPEKYFKYITSSSGLYEIRVEVGSDTYRVFSFFDKGRLVVIINGFQKKTPKIPSKELQLAEKIKKQYFDEKNT